MNSPTAATTVEVEDSAVCTSERPGAERPSKLRGVWMAIDRFLMIAGDWLNPILVKETRQSLKSFQFTLTFVLLLIACWLVTMGGVAIVGPRIYRAAEGGTLLVWYYAILAFPLAVVVPYAAFRSLAAEREDNTYDLLSITTLRSRQIISGKLGSAVVQMGVYFSAITPCLAFTYLLRGIDLPTIAILIAYLFFWSLGLSMIGILVATLTKRRFAHVFVSVVFVGSLLWLFNKVIVEEVMPAIPTGVAFENSDDDWITLAAIATVYVTSFALAYFAAAGMISFPSENRSTPLRICMLVQAAAFVGWASWAYMSNNHVLDGVLVTVIVAGIYWYVMGAMLTAERPGLSQRVKRTLPQSFLARMFFSWLNPGPASGYMFAVANATAMALICLLAVYVSKVLSKSATKWPVANELRSMIVIGWSYLVAYLGVGLLMIGALRRIAVVTMLASVLIHFLLLLAGFGIPYAIKSMSNVLRDAGYTFLQITDPIFSLDHVVNGGTSADTHKLLVIVPAVAMCVLLANMPGVIRELRVVREAAPQRVMQDEVELHPLPKTPTTSPWDEG